MAPAPFAVASEELDTGVRAIAVQGELDLSTAPELEQSLEAALAAEAPILLDLSACEFIDSTGIALIVRAWQRLGAGANGERGLALCCGNDQVRRLLEITGLHSSITLHEERGAALAELARAAEA